MENRTEQFKKLFRLLDDDIKTAQALKSMSSKVNASGNMWAEEWIHTFKLMFDEKDRIQRRISELHATLFGLPSD